MLIGLKYFEAKFTEEHGGTAEQIVSLSTYHLLIRVGSWGLCFAIQIPSSLRKVCQEDFVVSFPGVKFNKERSIIKVLALQWNGQCNIQAEDATDQKVTAQ